MARVRRGRLRLAGLIAVVLGIALWSTGAFGSGGATKGDPRGPDSRTGAGNGSAGNGSAGNGSATNAAAASSGISGPSGAHMAPGPNLAPGSDPSALPGNLLIADKANDRLIVVNPRGDITWEFPRPGDLAPGQSFRVPDDAFFSPDAKVIVATEEDDYVISVIDIATHRIVYRYGTPGMPGSGPNQVHNPDDALLLPNHDLLAADIKNCRILLIGPGQHTPRRVYGTTTSACHHDPPSHYGSPNGAFPMTNGHYLVTEINGDWVDELGLNGSIYGSTHPPNAAYPSDTNEVSPGVYLTADYSNPGQIETFTSQGQLLWRFKPTGANALNQPSLALPLPNGDIVVNDDYNHRVIVVDPRTNTIVWQYGHTHQAGVLPGYLRIPDGVDLAPPHSLTGTHATTMGLP